MSIQTVDLVLSARTAREQVGGVKVLDTPPWRMEGIDSRS